eukprot:scaffold23456_cov89-Isochrysis_galbana.AAC.1
MAFSSPARWAVPRTPASRRDASGRALAPLGGPSVNGSSAGSSVNGSAVNCCTSWSRCCFVMSNKTR